MVSESLIRKKFVSDTLREGIGQIYKTQQEVVRTQLTRRTGRLLTHVSKGAFDAQLGTGHHTLFVRLLPYMRFLDMQYRLKSDRISRHRRRKLALYNRVVWGVLYRETFPRLRYGFSDEVRRQLRQQLQQALDAKKNG